MATDIGIKRFRLTNSPTLPTTEEEMVLMELPFMVMSYGSNTSSSLGYACTKIGVAPDGIYYYMDHDGNSSTEATWVPVFTEGKWLSPTFRNIMVIIENEDFVIPEELQNYVARAPEDSELVSFEIMGHTLSAPVGATWLGWIAAQGYTSGFFSSPLDTVLIGGNWELYADGVPVNVFDRIGAEKEYTIPPQLSVDINTNEFLTIDYSNKRLGLSGFILPQGQTDFQISCLKDYYIDDVPLTTVNELVSYSITNSVLSVFVENLPVLTEEIVEIPSTTITLPQPQKRLLVLLTPEVIKEGNGVKVVAQKPPYKVNVSGKHYQGNAFNIKSSLETIGSAEVCGMVFPTMLLGVLFEQYANVPYEKFVMPGNSLLSSLNLGENVTQTENLIFFSDAFLEYCNKQIILEEMLGDYFIIQSSSRQDILDAFVEMAAAEAETSTEEMLILLEEEATSLGITLEEHLVSLIETEYKATIDTLCAFSLKEITEDNLYLVELWSEDVGILSTKFGDFEMSAMINTIINSYIGSVCLLYVREDGDISLKYTFSVEDSREFLLEESSELVLSNHKYRNDTEYNFNGLSSGSAYLGINSFVPPTVRGVPSTIHVEIRCLSGDSLITLENGDKKRLDEIKVGEKVLTQKGPEKVIYSDASLKKTKDEYVIYHLSNGTDLTVIKDHRVYSADRKRYVKISRIKNGERILIAGGETTTIASAEKINKSINHYTIFTENSNAYYANDVVCGNSFSNIKIAFIRKAAVKVFSWLCQKGGI